MESKKCSKCRVIKPIADFGKKQSYCRICATAVAKEWYRRNISRPEVHERLKSYYRLRQKEFKSLVDDIKLKLGCLTCDEKEVCCLDLHHVNGEKEAGIFDLVKRKNYDRLLVELKKCVCVCANCHRKIHAGIITPGKMKIDHASRIMCKLVEATKK